MLHNGVGCGAPIDWSDPEQAAVQVKIDMLRGMIACNPMPYSEKETLVRRQMADEARQAEASRAARGKETDTKWDI